MAYFHSIDLFIECFSQIFCPQPISLLSPDCRTLVSGTCCVTNWPRHRPVKAKVTIFMKSTDSARVRADNYAFITNNPDSTATAIVSYYTRPCVSVSGPDCLKCQVQESRFWSPALAWLTGSVIWWCFLAQQLHWSGENILRYLSSRILSQRFSYHMIPWFKNVRKDRTF